MTPVTATPSANPICCVVDSAPDALPARAGSMSASTIEVSGVKHRPMPAPTSSSPGTSAASEPPTTAASSARPSVRLTPPAAITARPNRCVSAGAGAETAT